MDHIKANIVALKTSRRLEMLAFRICWVFAFRIVLISRSEKGSMRYRA